MPTPEEILAICTQEGPGTPGPERGRAAAQRVKLQTKKGRSTYRPDHRRATQQQAQDAAVLCRWLNAEASLPAKFAVVPPPATPEQVEQLINTMLASIDFRHLFAVAHVEAKEKGHVIVSAGTAPRHQDWAGISPIWQRAAACEALITAGPAATGRAGLVVLHERGSRQLLTRPDSPVPGNVPEGAPSLVARILRHHGAATVGWLSFDSQPGGDPGSHTWASWHYSMPEELTKPPEGWTLSRNLTHSWLIQDTGQATTLAMYAAANADGAVGMAEEAREQGQEAAARGAAAAARLMADRAAKCLDQGQMLARQGLPQENSPQEIQELSTRVRRIRQQAQALPAPSINPKSQANQDQLWYADACHRLLRHKSLTTMADAMLEGIGPASGNDYHRYLTTLSAQQVCAWPSDNIYEIPEDYPIGREPDPGLASAVRLCEEQTHTVLAHMLTPLNEASPTDISPYLEDYPELAQRLRSTLVPAVGCDCGFEYSRYAPAPPEIGPVSASVGWTGFFWRGRRIFKGAAEAYPKTFPPQMAAGHTMLLKMRFAALIPDDPRRAPTTRACSPSTPCTWPWTPPPITPGTRSPTARSPRSTPPPKPRACPRNR